MFEHKEYHKELKFDNEELRILYCISKLRWAYSGDVEISEMDTNWIFNSNKMIEEKRGKISNYPNLAHIYSCLFKRELKSRNQDGESSWFRQV